MSRNRLTYRHQTEVPSGSQHLFAWACRQAGRPLPECEGNLQTILSRSSELASVEPSLAARGKAGSHILHR